MPESDHPLHRRAVQFGFAILVAALTGGAILYAVREVRGAEGIAASELAASATLKSRQISEWYRERLDDATGRSQDPLFIASAQAWIDGDRSPTLATRLQGSITPKREPWRYLNTWFLNPSGVAEMNARNRPAALDSQPGLVDECLRSRTLAFGGVHGLDTAQPYVDLCSPIAPEAGGIAAGAYLLRIDVSQLLLPIVQFWPRPSASAATVILHRRGDRFETLLSSNRADLLGAWPTRLPTDWMSGADGARRGANIAGTMMIGEVRSVAGTPWHVVLTIERSEVLADAVDELILVGLLSVVLVVAGVFGLQLVLQRRQHAHTLQIIRMDRLLQIRSAINHAIIHIHDRPRMFDRFCEIAVEFGRFELAAVFGALDEANASRLIAVSGAVPSRLTIGATYPLPDGMRHGALAPVFDGGEVVVVANLTALTAEPWIAPLVAAGHRAIVVVPIREHNLVTRYFVLYSNVANDFDHHDAQLFTELAGDICYALENVDADERRRAVEAQLLAVSDAAPFAIFLVRQSDHRIDRVNQAAIRQYGYAENELVGQPATMIFSRDDLVATEPAGEHAPLPVTATHRRKDGRPLTAEVTTRPIVVDGQTAVVVVAVDVSERRLLEEQYRQAQRLEAVGTLAGGIAHDFNNLLTVIGGFASFALEDIPDDSPAREAATQIKIATNRAAELTSQLLAFSRRQTMVARHVSMNEMVRETATMLTRLIGEHVVLDLKLESGRDTVNVDPSQMQQVIMNLAVNARDAMKGGGRLTIATADGPAGVELRVADTGGGIPPDVLEHIFEPFFTTKPPGEGTGLGLPTVHGIVTQSGGEVAVESAAGVGTIFTVRLPRAKAESEATAVQAASALPAGQGTILLVEDDPGVRALTSLVLTRGHYTVIECANGAAALDRVMSGQMPIDLLVSDVVMPGISGPELAERLRSYYPGLEVLFISGYAQDTATRLGLDLRTLDLLRKPFAPQELLRRVGVAMARARR